MSSFDQQPGSTSRPPQPPAGADATVMSRDEPAASWSGSVTEPRGGAPSTTGAIGRALEGTMLGPYRLDRFIGGGGMGAVFQALDTTLDRVVAVKVLAGRQADDEEMLKRFRNEAQSAARLDHENIGRVHAVGSEDGWHFIVFEYIEGTNLRDLVREQGPFDLVRTVDVSIQVADALEHASQRDVVHRDIKPSNIVITPAGKARIVDMGLARLPQVADDRDLTVSGMTLGTFDYISPEQARDPRAADVRSDLYSLGCTIYFMLAGRPPFADGTMVQKLLQHQQAPPPPIDDVRPDVPRRFAEIVARLMAKDPLERYQRPADLVADLRSFAEEHGVPIATQWSAPTPTPTPTPRTVSRLPWAVPVAGLLAVVTAMWAMTAWDRRAASSRPTANQVLDGAAIVRVVAGAAGPGDTTSLADAVRRVADGGTVELAFDGILREPPLSLAGRQLVIRAAGGVRPIVAFDTASAPRAAAPVAACDLGDGDLTIRGVSLRIIEDASRPAAPLFALRAGRLLCDDVTLAMPGDPAASASGSSSTASFVTLGSGPAAASIVFRRVRAAGDGVLLAGGGATSGRATLRWTDGEFVSPRVLIAADGTPADQLEIDSELQGVTVACGAGILVLRDSAARPVPVRARLRATDCRFVVTDPSRPFIEQVGEADADDYRAACQWIDGASRYEGGGEFRRIDAATERIHEAVRDVVPSLFHRPTPGRIPDATTWPGWGR